MSTIEKALSAIGESPLTDYLRAILSSSETASLEPWEVASCGKSSTEDAIRALEILESAGLVARSNQYCCPACGTSIELEEVDDSCPACDQSFLDRPLERQVQFVKTGIRGRDTRWMFTIHGMNTRGPWQQDFSWSMAKGYGYSIPIFTYKYGVLRLSPFLYIGQQRYVEQLRADIKSKILEMDAETRGKPDLLAHSFGTWLLYRVLETDHSIQVGRIILTGSIVPPSFSWAAVIARGQAEAVLCHTAGKDVWVRAAAYFIPGAGPSGAIGFNEQSQVHHLCSPNFGHSDFFKPATLRELIGTDWASFLSAMPSAPKLGSPCFQESHDWRFRWYHRAGHLVKYVALLTGLCISVFLLVSLVVGVFAVATFLQR